MSVIAVVLATSFTHAQFASASTKPPSDATYYVAPTDSNSDAQTFGCNQAKADNADGHGSYVTLDFGAQKSDGSGTYLPSTTVFWSNSADQTYADKFAYGYQNCLTTRNILTLSVGTNNSGSTPNGTLGADWGAVVAHVGDYVKNNGYGNVIIQGAIDAEGGWSSFSAVHNWQFGCAGCNNGYLSNTSRLISDFGTADGCPQTYNQYGDQNPCTGDWYLRSVYDVSYGWNANVANPEIYYNGCNGYANQPVQWANVSDYGKHYGANGQTNFEAPLSQGNCLDAQQAWNDFQSALNTEGVTSYMPYSTFIITK